MRNLYSDYESKHPPLVSLLFALASTPRKTVISFKFARPNLATPEITPFPSEVLRLPPLSESSTRSSSEVANHLVSLRRLDEPFGMPPFFLKTFRCFHRIPLRRRSSCEFCFDLVVCPSSTCFLVNNPMCDTLDNARSCLFCRQLCMVWKCFDICERWSWLQLVWCHGTSRLRNSRF